MTIYPTLNNNGDMGQTLIDQQLAINDKARDLLLALREASPHGRNFQTAQAGDYDKARREHAEIYGQVVLIRDVAMKTAMNVQDQGK